MYSCLSESQIVFIFVSVSYCSVIVTLTCRTVRSYQSNNLYLHKLTHLSTYLFIYYSTNRKLIYNYFNIQSNYAKIFSFKIFIVRICSFSLSDVTVNWSFVCFGLLVQVFINQIINWLNQEHNEISRLTDNDNNN